MYAITANQTKNRLYMQLKGFMEDDEMHAAAEVLIIEVNKLRPGFDVINDISECKPATKQGSLEIARCQKYVIEHGVRHVMRVLGTNAITRMQFSRTSKEAGSEAVTEEVSSFEEAEKRLDTLLIQEKLEQQRKKKYGG